MIFRSFGALLFFQFVTLMTVPAFGQISADKKAQHALQAGKWATARQTLRKILAKDTSNTEAIDMLATYFASPSNPAFQLDSAYEFVNRALTTYALSSPRQKERLARVPIDSNVLLRKRARIDSMAFEAARSQNTERAYQSFIDRFAFAAQTKTAVDLRNEVAYLEALRQNTIASYQQYLKRYPGSARASEAHTRLEQLLFREATQDGKLSSYRSFLARHPQTLYRKEVETRIFEISTASGRAEDYLQFLDECQNCSIRPQALRLWYYIHRESGMPLPEQYATDSLRWLQQLKSGYVVPFLKNGLFGFMDSEGRELLEARFQAIDDAYRCGGLQQDFFLTSDGLVARSGLSLLRDSVKSVDDLGFGFLKATLKNGGVKVVNKSGTIVTPQQVEDVRLVARSFLAIKQEGRWGLRAFNGLLLLPNRYEDISSIDQIIILQRVAKMILVRSEAIAAVADRNELKEDLVFDDVKAWGGGSLLVRNGMLEGVLNQALEFEIPFDRHRLSKTSFGFVQEKEGKIRIRGLQTDHEPQVFDRIRDFGNWVEVMSSGDRQLYTVPQMKLLANKLDTVWLTNKVMFAQRNDSLLVFTRTTRLATFSRPTPMKFITSRDSSVYFYLQERNRKIVYEAATGSRGLTTDADELEHLGRGFFLATKSKKRGVLNSAGEWVLPAQYDVIVQSAPGLLSLYKDKKFGLLNLDTKKLIKPVFERNLQVYSDKWFIAFQQGGYGLIGQDEKPVTDFEFDEVCYWNDSVALVKKNYFWSFYEVASKEIRMDKVRAFERIANGKETILKVQRENYYGVISDRRGVLITPGYTDIINVGTDDVPLYFVEKAVEEADIHVVLYYNKDGRMVRKQVYETPDFDRIVCEDN